MTTDHKAVFGPFTLNLASDCLFRDGAEVPLRPQALRVLRALVVQGGLYLDHPQMIRQAWDGTQVSKHTITVTISEVKRALGQYSSWITCHPKLGYCLEVPDSEEMLRFGWHHMNRRTREGLEKAVRIFEQAALAGAQGRALEGASRAYLMLGTFGMWSPEASYPKFLTAHERVVELRGYNPEMRVDRGLGYCVFERRFDAAEEQMLLALAEQPKLGSAYTHLSVLYLAWRRPEKALEMLQAARAADALQAELALAEIMVRFCGRDYVGAQQYGSKMLELHPHFPAAIIFYAATLEALGRFEEALEQYHMVCMLAPDMPWYRALEAACFAKAGQTNRARTILMYLEKVRETDYVDGFHMSLLMHALGRTDDAFAELERAYREGCTTLSLMDVDPKVDALRGDPRFTILRNKLFPHDSAVAS
ncbi:MAG: tetratricopeptide repeat protein [Bryobacteraceae bacterium]